MFKFSSRPARVSTAAAAAAKSRRSVASPEQPDWIAIRRRERPQDLELAPHTVRWWDTLPSEVRPVHLAQKFPRIANLLSLCWNDPRLIRETFDSLLNDKRGSRQGFPTMILSELRRLRAHALDQTAEPPRAVLLATTLWQTEAATAEPADAVGQDAWDPGWQLTTDR